MKTRPVSFIITADFPEASTDDKKLMSKIVDQLKAAVIGRTIEEANSESFEHNAVGDYEID